MGDCANGALAAAGTLVIGGGLLVGIGAASGAIGAAIFNNSYPDWTEITTSEFTNAMMVGEIILGTLPLMSMSLVACAMGASYDAAGAVSVSSSGYGLCTHAVSGAITGMLGAAVLGLIDGGSDVGFSAAAGAVGAILGSLAVGIPVVCIVGGCIAGGGSFDAAPVDELPVQKEVNKNKADLVEVKINDDAVPVKRAAELERKKSSLMYSARAKAQSFFQMVGLGAQPAQKPAMNLGV